MDWIWNKTNPPVCPHCGHQEEEEHWTEIMGVYEDSVNDGDVFDYECGNCGEFVSAIVHVRMRTIRNLYFTTR